MDQPMTLLELHQRTAELLTLQAPTTPTNVTFLTAREKPKASENLPVDGNCHNPMRVIHAEVFNTDLEAEVIRLQGELEKATEMDL